MTSYEMPAGTDLSESMQPTILAVNIIGFVLSAAAVGLRLVARKMSNAPLWWDDWMIVLALVVATVFLFFNTTWMVPHGLGKHIWAASSLSEAIFAFNLGLFILEICYTTVIVLVKYSILAFYWRIFQVPSIKLPILVLGGVITSWGIALWLVTIFQCIPVQGFWDKTIQSTCSVNVTSFFFGNSIPNIITDIAIMVLPMPWILRLQLAKGQKIALVGIFAIGTLVVIISTTRLVYVLNLDLVNIDIMWNFNNTEIWTTLEVFIAIICACLPSHKPIISLVFRSAFASRKATSNSNLNTSRSNTWANFKNSINMDKKMPGDDDENRLFKRLPGHDGSKSQVKVMTTTSTSERGAASESDLELEDLRGVQVTRKFDVQWHNASS